MSVSKNAKIVITRNANPKICLTPKSNPKREQVEYRSLWVPNARGWHWPCRFHVVCLVFGRVGYPTQTQYPVEYRLKGRAFLVGHFR